MGRFIDTITHQICKQWRTDMIRLKIGEDRKYLLVGPGSEAGFRLVELVVDYKGNDDVAPMFERSRGLWAKFPRRWYQTEGPTLDAPTGNRTRPRTSFTRNPHTSATYTWPVTMRSPPPPGTLAAWTRPPCRFSPDSTANVRFGSCDLFWIPHESRHRWAVHGHATDT